MLRTAGAKGRTGAVQAAAMLMVAAGLCVGAAHAQPAGFWLTGKAPDADFSRVLALSADGRVAGGYSSRLMSRPPVGLRWTREAGREDLTQSPVPNTGPVIEGLSADGAYASGSLEGFDPGRVSTLFRRGPDGIVQNLGTLPGYERAATGRISRDGRVVAGVARRGRPSPDQESMPFRWTEGGGAQSLGVLPGTSVLNEAGGVSADGRVIVGWGTDGATERGWVWREGLGMSALPGDAELGLTRAFGVSGDGRFVVGRSLTVGRSAVRWDLVTQSYELLPVLPGYDTFEATAISDDGRTIAGLAARGSGQAPFVWREGEGVFFLRDYLAMNGVGVPGAWVFSDVAAMSADGRTFAGSGRSVPGPTNGYIATVPAPSAAVLMTPAGALAFRRRR